MNSDRFSRVRRIFVAACDVPVDDRAPLLERECGDDTALRQEVEYELGLDVGKHLLLLELRNRL